MDFDLNNKNNKKKEEFSILQSEKLDNSSVQEWELISSVQKDNISKMFLTKTISISIPLPHHSIHFP